MEACRDVLLAHGIWMTQLPVPAPVELGPGHIGLLTKLTHAESGQWQSSLAVVPLPKADPQGMGSAITYARRYALTAMLGIITEEDDDGEAAKRHPKTSGRVKQPINGAQVQKGFQDRRMSFLKHVNGGLIFVNSPILKFVNGAQKPHLRCADSLPTIRFPAVYLPFLKNQWKITWISRSVCE